MAGHKYFGPEFFKFLKQLEQHNDRDWFLANKDRFEKDVRDPFLHFLDDLRPGLRKISPNFVVDSRPVGGSMWRIYRDTRFSKDKTPYKTAIAAHFEHVRGKSGSTPGFYLHLEPGKSGVGAGVWHPEPPALKRIRDAIASDPKGWSQATAQGKSGSACGFIGESLKRPPPGYDAAHPFIEDIKRKDFAASVSLTDRVVTSADCMDAVLEAYRSIAPFTRFLTEAVRLAF